MKKDPIVDTAVRKVPDFPHKGILFYDITGILCKPEAFDHIQNRLDELYAGKKLSAVAAVESRGFLFAAPLAHRLGLPLVLVRKKGKLPGKTIGQSYALEYGTAEIEVHTDDVPQGGSVLVIDDLLATGGTLNAAASLLEKAGARVTDLFCVIGLPFLHPERILGTRNVEVLHEYSSESI